MEHFYIELEINFIQKVLCQNGCIFIWFMNVSLKSVQILYHFMIKIKKYDIINFLINNIIL